MHEPKRHAAQHVPVALLLWVLAMTCWGPSSASELPQLSDPERYKQRQVKDLVALVNEAAALVQTDGEKAFESFHQPGKWLDLEGETYIFVFDMEGNQTVNAAFHSVEGVNRLDWKDARGKPVFRLAIDKLSPHGENLAHWWVHYLWPKPGAVRPSWKSTYLARVKAPSGTVYAVAGGVYNVAPEKLFVEQMVEDAIALIESQGPTAFDTISRRDSEFIFDDLFVFVMDDKGVERANAGFTHLIGKNLLELPGFAGRDLIRRELDFVKAQGSGWMVGEWPRIGKTEPVREDIYLKSLRFSDETFIVGSGIYRE